MLWAKDYMWLAQKHKENGNFLFFLKLIYRIMTDSSFFNKSCPIFDNNMVSIALFCRFLPFFLQSEPQIGQIPIVFT